MRPVSASLILSIGLAAGPAYAYDLGHDFLPKVNAQCGLQLTFTADKDSLKKHNKDIAWDQTDGQNECGEPLRYLWYACKTPAGLAAVKKAKLSAVTCGGTADAAGALTLSSGTLLVRRAYEEPKPYLRSRRQFETALGITLTLGDPDPYRDEAWRAIASQPNPVASVTTYCLVNGGKLEFDEQLQHRYAPGTVQCWQDGKAVIDLVIAAGGKKAGFATWHRDALYQRETYRDGKQEGETRRTEGGVLTWVAFFEKGNQVWEKDLYPDGKLKHYSRQVKDGYLTLKLGPDGKLQQLQCLPAAREDPVMRDYCGFDSPATQAIYDASGKVAKTVVYANGVLQRQGVGDSPDASGSEVAYQDGKKHGEERVLGKGGKLLSVTTWSHGLHDGPERFYDDDGKKVVEEISWKGNVRLRRTRYYLNGNKELEEVYELEQKKSAKRYWDTGKVAEEGSFLRCRLGGYGYHFEDWCEEGPYTTYYESGARESEMSFKGGHLQGELDRWWEDWKPAAIEQYDQGRLTKAKVWDQAGKVTTDEEYEADGSRKLKKG